MNTRHSLPLILASTSPRRRQLLEEAGIAFELFAVPIDEDGLTTTYTGPLDRLAEFLATGKARAAIDALRSAQKTSRVLASDTTVLLDGDSLSKPRDAAEARGMLDRLRGREHIVATGVAFGSTKSYSLSVATSVTRVLMRNYGEAEVEAFIASGDPYDKAGGYSIQHADFQPVARFIGCHLGVVGLPVCIVAALLDIGSLPPVEHDGSCHWSSICTQPYPLSTAIHQSSQPADAP